MLLTNHNFYSLYSTGEKADPISFFSDALSSSVQLDLGLGFFSSASINVLCLGFAKFISNGGRIRMYINQFLSDEDYTAFTSSPEQFEDELIENFHSMLGILSKRDEHFFNCISYLIHSGRMDVRIVIPHSGGIAHQKFGVFTDSEGNKVSFIGSLNMTAAALTSKNIESISCLASWKGAEHIIGEYESLFNGYFNAEKDGISVIKAERLTKEITKAFPSKDEKSIIEEEKVLLESWKKEKTKPLPQIVLDNTPNEPHFPYPTGAFPYQVEAYQNWLANGCTGIFAMATGTGKTITSLNCALEEYKKTKKYKLLILVPSNDLVTQWVGEVGKFSFENIYLVNGKNDWRQSLTELKNEAAWGIESNYVVISTYASFTDPSFQNLIKKLNNEDMILIADEAHNVGSATVRKAFETLPIKKRIALSATPNRKYDEDGTRAIELFFHDRPPYCYSFSMERAIKEGRLMHYLYFPRIAYLNESETNKYMYYTRKLLEFFDPKTSRFVDSPEVADLLIKRKRVIHKAQDKYRVFMEIVDELVSINKTKYCFVYTPEGIDYTDGEERIIEKMQGLVYEKYPQILTNTFTGGDQGRKDKLRAFAEGKIDMLFAMKCLDEGVDVPRAEVGIFTSSTGNPRQFIQRRGRLLRKHPEKAFAYIFDTVIVPDYNQINEHSIYEMERSLVRGELMRVAYFASLSDNYYDARKSLSDIMAYYKLEIGSLISELQMQ